MKRTTIAALLLLGPRFAFARYFDTILSDPMHPAISATALFTSRLKADGGEAAVATVYHKGDPNDTFLPKAVLDLGVDPISWTLLELGGGANTQTAFGTVGTSVNVSPAVLGPLASYLRSKGGNYATAGDLIVAKDGSGVKLGAGWKATVIDNGAFLRFNQLRFPPRYGVGYCYKFK